MHAAATPYRERSHFDGQDVLESGLTKPGSVESGWLNRALSLLAADGRVRPPGRRALAVGAVTPLVVRGPAPVMSWIPQRCCRRATIPRCVCSISIARSIRSSPSRSKAARIWSR